MSYFKPLLTFSYPLEVQRIIASSNLNRRASGPGHKQETGFPQPGKHVQFSDYSLSFHKPFSHALLIMLFKNRAAQYMP